MSLHASSGPSELPAVEGFELEGELGRGGMGIAYLARDVRRDRRVVIKMLRGGRRASPMELARFYIEAGAISSLKHPNIVRIHEVGLHEGCPFLVLEYARKGDLSEYLKARPPDPRRAAEITLLLADALQHAHERGILHRDLKPSNILVMEDETLKITDFGLAKFIKPAEQVLAFTTISFGGYLTQLGLFLGSPHYEPDTLASELRETLGGRKDPGAEPTVSQTVEEASRFVEEWRHQVSRGSHDLNDLTAVGVILGTPHYMAPEQMGQFPSTTVGPEADVYGLGAILYRMLAGRPPYSDHSFWEMDERSFREPPSPIVPAVAVDLEAICTRCLVVPAEHRYRSAAQLAEDLRRFLDGRRTLAVDELPPTHGTTPRRNDAQPTVRSSIDPTSMKETTRSWAATCTWWLFGKR